MKTKFGIKEVVAIGIGTLTKEKGTNVDAGNIVAKKAVAKSVAAEKEVMKQEKLDLAETINLSKSILTIVIDESCMVFIDLFIIDPENVDVNNPAFLISIL